MTIAKRLDKIFSICSGSTFCHFISGKDVAEVEKITFRDMDLRSKTIGSLIAALPGVAPGDQVGFMLGHDPFVLFGFVGCLRQGILPVIMAPPSEKQDPEIYWSGLKVLIETNAIKAIITRPDIAVRLSEFAIDIEVVTSEQLLDFGPQKELRPNTQPQDTAFIQYSSGTTGLKKGVAVSHAAVLRQVDAYAGQIRLAKTDCIVSWLPLYHDMGLVACFLMPLLRGIPLVLMDPFLWVVRPVLLFEAIEAYSGTLCWLPNFAFHHLCRSLPDQGLPKLTTMRAFINCSEPAKAETAEAFVAKFRRVGMSEEMVQVCYAMAETVFAVTQTELLHRPKVVDVDRDRLVSDGIAKQIMEGRKTAIRRILSVGSPIQGADVEIVDENGRVLEDGCIGEIRIRADFMFDGYVGPSFGERSCVSATGHPSGDLGFLLNGELYVTGRKKEVIIVHGRNFYAHDIEVLVNRCPDVIPGRSVAIGVFDERTASEEIIVVAETRVNPGDYKALRKAVKEEVLKGLDVVVGHVALVPPKWLIKTSSGKISRNQNKAKFLEETGGLI